MTATATTATVFRVELVYRDPEWDGEGRRLADALEEVGLTAARAEYRAQYLLEGDGLTAAQVETLAYRLLADPITQTAAITPGDVPPPAGDTPDIIVQLRVGVMDPVAQSVMRGAADLGIPLRAARTVRKYRIHGATADHADALETLARRFIANDVIEETFRADQPVTALSTGQPWTPERVDITGFRDLDDEGLLAISVRHGLALDIEEMRAIRAHYAALNRDPTDVELETIAQTWSEHCKHKTLTGLVDYTERPAGQPAGEPERIDNLLKSTIVAATNELGRDDFCLSLFVDNAGVIAFDEQYGVAMKVETHNHPSALEPYGGAGTGIGGVIRDILGTGLGAHPIMNTNVFCFGPLDLPAEKLPRGLLHPRRVMQGVVAGVRDYGNRMGIPTANGAIFFHDRYLGNPLVYAGCVGLIPRDKVAKEAQPGDAIVVVGGRTGRDGIGGATFSSLELTSESETVSSGAVQIGNAIEEKRVMDVLLQARDRGLFTAVTDCGAGGLSSAVGEMGETIGADVDLATVPLKYEGLSAREIWLSEAQERMVLAVPPDRLDETLALFAAEDVDAVAIGTYEPTGRLRLRYGDLEVGELQMAFIHDGLPRTVRAADFELPAPAPTSPPVRNSQDYTADLNAVLGLPNVCSKEPVVRQYDHEVQAGTAIRPFVGARSDGPGDAAVVCPVPGSTRGVVVSNGLNPELGLIDPYHMAANAIDEAVRNALAVGGSMRKLALLDNFSWGNCNKPDRFGGLVRAAKACYDLAKAYETPFISGKDSLNNEYRTEAGETIAIPPTLLISAVGIVDDVPRQALTMDLKAPGSQLCLLGFTRPELAAAHILLARGLTGGTDVPQVRPNEALMTFDLVENLRDEGLLLSCHDCAEGGLAAAVAEMCLAGGFGAELDVSHMVLIDDASDESDAPARNVTRLFSESPSRFVVELPADGLERARSICASCGTLITPLGTVTTGDRLIIQGEGKKVTLVDALIEDLRTAWQAPLNRWFE